MQPPDLIIRSHSAWLLTFGEMPLPCGPVPGNSPPSGMREQREPVAGRVVLRRGVRVRRDHRREIQRLARRGRHLWRIDQPVAAHPHRVAGLRQIGQQVAALIVGDDDLRRTSSADRWSRRSPRRRPPAPLLLRTTPPMSSASTAIAAGCRALMVVSESGQQRSGHNGSCRSSWQSRLSA